MKILSCDIYPSQAAEGVVRALDDGLFRIRVQVSVPEFDPKVMPIQQGSLMSFINIGVFRTVLFCLCFLLRSAERLGL